ncbi:MAG: single-stranded DNA-binding protein [Thermoplasmatales archaeon]
MSFNKITIIGNLGRDPELRYTPQGDPVCNFSVAVNEKKRDKAGELQDVTTWFRVTLWRKMAETASKYLTKGSPVYIEGRLHVEEWIDREGKNRYTLEVTASDMHLIGNRNAENIDQSTNTPEDQLPSHTSSSETTFSDDDIPF